MPKNLPRNQPGEPGRHAISIANIRSLISELQEYGKISGPGSGVMSKIWSLKLRGFKRN